MASGSILSEHYLEGLQNTAREALEQTNALFAHLDTNQLNWKPAPKAWSIAQCYQHLILLNSLYYAAIGRAMPIAVQHNNSTRNTFTPGVFGAWFRRMLEPKAARKIPTFGIFTPEASTLPASILDDFAENQHTLLRYIEQAHNVDLTRTKIATPVSRFLRLRLGDAFAILLTHEQRHIAQAQRVVQHAGFPQPPTQ